MIPLKRLPSRILLNVLKKLTFLSWFRFRRTCHFISDFISKEVELFSIDAGTTSFLEIKYDFNAKSLTLEVTKDDGHNGHYEDKIDITHRESTLSGIKIGCINIECPNHRLYSDENWRQFEEVMTNFSRNVILRCAYLQSSIRFEKFPFLAPFLKSFNFISTGTCHDDTNHVSDWAQYITENEAMDVVQHPNMKGLIGLHFITKCQELNFIPLMHKVQLLSFNYQPVPQGGSEIWKDMNQLFKEIHLGTFDDQRKVLDFSYFCQEEHYYSNGFWKFFPELHNISIQQLWNYQIMYNNIHDKMNRKLIFLIQTKGCFAICLFRATSGSQGLCLIDFDLIMEPTFNPVLFTHIFDILHFRREEHTELMELIEAQDWKAFSKALTKREQQ